MGKQAKNVAVAALAAGALAVGAAVVADAASNGSSSSSGSSTQQGTAQQAPPPRDSARPVHPGETALSGDTAQKVKDAALKKVPGASVIRVETDAEGSPYEAHLRKSDGSEVTAKVSKEFQVTKVEQGFGAGPHGPGGPTPGSGNGTSYGVPGAPTVTG